MRLVLKILRTKRKILMLYNVPLIKSQMEALGLDEKSLALAAGVSTTSSYAAVKGVLGTLSKLKAITDALNIKWQYITDIDLPEGDFPRAVLTNGERRGRSVKPGSRSVGVSRPRR